MVMLAGVAVGAQSAKPAVKMTTEQFSQITTDYNALQKEVQQLQAQQQELQEAVQKLERMRTKMTELLPRIRSWEAKVDAAGGSSQAQLFQATKQLQDMNQSFNRQYLQLQKAMQDESRRFTLLSNVMKTKHDTAKNSISNVR
jgi:chromosome segregation ATPase